MKTVSARLLSGLVALSVMASCSRPVAYFQPTPRPSFAVQTPTAAVAAVTPTTNETPTATPVLTEAAQAKVALAQLDAVASTNPNVMAHKSVAKRIAKVRTMLTAAAATPTTHAAPVATTKKAGLVERMMLKKMDRQLKHHIAPNQPEKAMISGGSLTLGIILGLGGLLLMLLTSGVASTIGLIALLAGIVIIILGLI